MSPSLATVHVVRRTDLNGVRSCALDSGAQVRGSFDRASLRRLARQVQRREDPGDRFEGESSLWYVASHVSAIIKQRRPVTLVAPGCYRIGPDWFSTFWIAANELPLVEDETRWEIDPGHPYHAAGIDESMSIDATKHSSRGGPPTTRTALPNAVARDGRVSTVNAPSATRATGEPAASI